MVSSGSSDTIPSAPRILEPDPVQGTVKVLPTVIGHSVPYHARVIWVCSARSLPQAAALVAHKRSAGALRATTLVPCATHVSHSPLRQAHSTRMLSRVTPTPAACLWHARLELQHCRECAPPRGVQEASTHRCGGSEPTAAAVSMRTVFYVPGTDVERSAPSGEAKIHAGCQKDPAEKVRTCAYRTHI